VQDAKVRFNKVIEAHDARPKPSPNMASPRWSSWRRREYARLQRLEHVTAPRFTDHLLAMPRDDGTFERLQGTS